MKIKHFYLAVVSILAASSTAVEATTNLNIDFGQSSGSDAPSSSYGAASGQAGVWNVITATGESSLVGLNGQATSAVLSLNASSVAGMGTGQTAGTDVNDLLGDNFYSAFNGSWSFTITGLANGTYDFYFYSSQNSSVPTGAITANGLSHSSIGIPSPNTATFDEGVNWGVIRDVIVSDGTLTVTGGVLTNHSTGLAGVQLIPEPSTYLLMGTAAAAFALLRRKRKID